MASVYTTSALVVLELGTGRATMLQDRDGDGVADTGVLTDAIGKAGTLIDARLAKRFVVPFALVTDSPATPDLVTMIATYLTCHVLYKRFEPAGDDQAYYWRQADALMNDILSGRTDIPGATLVASTNRLRSVTVAASDPVLAGVDPTTDDPSDSASIRRTFGM